MFDELLARIVELESCIHILHQENNILIESAQTIELFRKIAEVAQNAKNETELAEILLEHVSILMDFPWCAYFVSRGKETQCIASYAAVSDESILLKRVELSSGWIDLQEDNLFFFDEEDACAVGISLNFATDIIPSRIFCYRFNTTEKAAGMLLFVSEDTDLRRLDDLTPLLYDVSLMVALRLERQGFNNELHRLNGELNRLNAELSQKIVGRTAALRESERNYRAIFEQTTAGIVNINKEGYILHCNQRFLSILGYTAIEEVIGRLYMDFIHPDSHFGSKERVLNLWLGNLSHDVQEIRFLKKNNDVIWTQVSTSALRDEQGRTRQINAVVLDVNKHKETEATLIQVQKMHSIGELAGGIAHDFNNLLTPILIACDFQLENKHDALVREDLLTIQLAAKRASALTQKILAFSRKQLFKLESISLHRQLKQITPLLRRTIPANIKIEIDAPESLQLIEGDVVQLEQVVMNLVVNAKDAMPEGGILSITADDVFIEDYTEKGPSNFTPGDYVRLRVHDTGGGIPPEIVNKIFEPFFSTKPAGYGTGLGLATVHGIVHQHHGYIWAESWLGKGSLFTLLFPASQKPVRELSQQNPKSVELKKQTRIVVADDDEWVRKLAYRILHEQGYEVLEYPDGLSCLQACGEGKPSIHLLLTDLVMPQMSGYELYRALKTHHSDLRVLFTSGYAPEAFQDKMNICSEFNFLPKPFSVLPLLNAVHTVLHE